MFSCRTVDSFNFDPLGAIAERLKRASLEALIPGRKDPPKAGGGGKPGTKPKGGIEDAVIDGAKKLFDGLLRGKKKKKK